MSNNLYGLFEEPVSHINNLGMICNSIIENLKSFLITFWEFPKIPVDQRLAVGSMLLEYIYPLIQNDLLMEEQML